MRRCSRKRMRGDKVKVRIEKVDGTLTIVKLVKGS